MSVTASKARPGWSLDWRRRPSCRPGVVGSPQSACGRARPLAAYDGAYTTVRPLSDASPLLSPRRQSGQPRGAEPRRCDRIPLLSSRPLGTADRDQPSSMNCRRRVAQFLLDAFVGLLPWSLVLALGLVHAVRSRRDPAVRWALLSYLVPLAVIVLSSARLRICLLPVYPAAAILAAWWADARGTERARLARVLAWLLLASVVIALGVAPWILEVRELQAFFLIPGFVWKALLSPWPFSCWAGCSSGDSPAPARRWSSTVASRSWPCC